MFLAYFQHFNGLFPLFFYDRFFYSHFICSISIENKNGDGIPFTSHRFHIDFNLFSIYLYIFFPPSKPIHSNIYLDGTIMTE